MADKLWLRMAARYGHAWVSQYGAAPDRFSGAEWRMTLAGLTDDDIRIGFDEDRLRGADWPPSSTAFRAMCLAVPSYASVAQELREDSAQRSQFTRLVWQHLDTWRFARAEQSAAERMLRDAYNLAREYVMRGGSLPEPSLAVECAQEEPRQPPDPEFVARHLSDIARSLDAGDIDPAVAEESCSGVDLSAVESELLAHYRGVQA